MKLPKSKSGLAPLLIVFTVIALAAGCSDDGTAPKPGDGDISTTQRTLTLDRHSLPMIRAWSFSPELTYACGYFISIARLTGDGAVIESVGEFPMLADIWATSPSDIFTVGYESLSAHGAIFHYNGTDWTDMSHPLQHRIAGVFGSSSRDVFAVGQDGMIAHYDGARWSGIYTHSGSLTDGWASKADTLFVVGDAGTILRYDGDDWVDQTVSRNIHFVGIWGTGPSNVYALGDSGIYHYNGTDWTLSFDNGVPLMGIDGWAHNNIYAVGFSGTILHYGGTAWTPVVIPGLDQTLVDVSMSSGTDAIVVGAGGTVLRLAGIGWSIEHEGHNLDWVDVSGSGPNQVSAVAAEGTLAVWDGIEWNYTATTTGFSPTGVWTASPNHIWMCGIDTQGLGLRQPVVYSYDGATWDAQYQPKQWLSAIRGAADDDIYVVGEGGLVAHFNGTGWSDTTLSMSIFNDVWSLPGADAFVVGDEGTIFHYDGSDWIDRSRGGSTAINAVYGTSATDVLAVGDDGLLLRFDGYIWRSEIGGSIGGYRFDLSDVWASAPDDYWVIGANGVLFHYDGDRWQAIFSATIINSYQRGLWGSSSGELFICGSGDLLARYTTQ